MSLFLRGGKVTPTYRTGVIVLAKCLKSVLYDFCISFTTDGRLASLALPLFVYFPLLQPFSTLPTSVAGSGSVTFIFAIECDENGPITVCEAQAFL